MLQAVIGNGEIAAFDTPNDTQTRESLNTIIKTKHTKQKLITNLREPTNPSHTVGSELPSEEIMLPQSTKTRSSKKSDSTRKHFDDVIMHHYHILNLIS